MANYEWNGAPPTVAQRVVAGVYVIVLLAFGASSYLGWRLLGPYDRQATACWMILGLVLFTRFMPMARRID